MAARHDLRPTDRRSPWQENHGNFLLAVAAAILLLGGAVLAYRQWWPETPTYRHIRAQPEAVGLDEDPADPLEAAGGGPPTTASPDAESPAVESPDIGSSNAEAAEVEPSDAQAAAEAAD